MGGLSAFRHFNPPVCPVCETHCKGDHPDIEIHADYPFLPESQRNMTKKNAKKKKAAKRSRKLGEDRARRLGEDR